jgi:hypothetical protein
MRPDASYFSILLCLTPDDFTPQVVSVPLNGLMRQRDFNGGDI